MALKVACSDAALLHCFPSLRPQRDTSTSSFVVVSTQAMFRYGKFGMTQMVCMMLRLQQHGAVARIRVPEIRLLAHATRLVVLIIVILSRCERLHLRCRRVTGHAALCRKVVIDYTLMSRATYAEYSCTCFMQQFSFAFAAIMEQSDGTFAAIFWDRRAFPPYLDRPRLNRGVLKSFSSMHRSAVPFDHRYCVQSTGFRGVQITWVKTLQPSSIRNETLEAAYAPNSSSKGMMPIL